MILVFLTKLQGTVNKITRQKRHLEIILQLIQICKPKQVNCAH